VENDDLSFFFFFFSGHDLLVFLNTYLYMSFTLIAIWSERFRVRACFIKILMQSETLESTFYGKEI
jgi:hypothetical protein